MGRLTASAISLQDREKWLMENVTVVDRRDGEELSPESTKAYSGYEVFFEFEEESLDVFYEPQDGWLQTNNNFIILPFSERYTQDDVEKMKQDRIDLDNALYGSHDEMWEDDDVDESDLPEYDQYGYEILPPLTEEEQDENDARYEDYVEDDYRSSHWDMVLDHHEFNDY